jgi:UDP-N-acetylglucosamine 2-epimerase (non-hydrolysing)
MLKICIVAGARPNFMKIAPLLRELSHQKVVESLVVHTGQHYDDSMSKQFFRDLEMSEPSVFLGVGSGSHAQQTARVMMEFEKVLQAETPHLVVVVGDVNSTLACALTAVKLGIKVAHVEAGLRSFDRSMPEEINRILTDAISDFLFITEESALENLIREGVPKERICFVGNVMIDTLFRCRERAKQSNILIEFDLQMETIQRSCSLSSDMEPLQAEDKATRDYAVLTLHRPSNVDSKECFTQILDVMMEISQLLPIVFPAHPRTHGRIRRFGLEQSFKFLSDKDSKVADKCINCTGPLGYLDFLRLLSKAKLVLTDSGGIQEETTVLGIPCVTIRENTERPITLTHGTNRLAGTDKLSILKNTHEALSNGAGKACMPPLWDGQAAKRIVEHIVKVFGH